VLKTFGSSSSDESEDCSSDNVTITEIEFVQTSPNTFDIYLTAVRAVNVYSIQLVFKIGETEYSKCIRRTDNLVEGTKYLLFSDYQIFGFIEENVGETFDPTDTDSFTIVPDAIEIPYSQNKGYAQSINEVGDLLIIGTGFDTVYFWDRKSILPNYVVNMPENNTCNIIVVGSKIFAFNGFNGTIFLMVFSAAIIGKIRLSDDHSEFNYVLPKNIKKSDLTPISEKAIFV
jgi:hypothetical protein